MLPFPESNPSTSRTCVLLVYHSCCYIITHALCSAWDFKILRMSISRCCAWYLLVIGNYGSAWMNCECPGHSGRLSMYLSTWLYASLSATESSVLR
jgi:hypothetical protein